MTDMPRLKPDPVPAIHTVPEYAATGALAEVYARTRAGFGVPWMGVVTMAFAQFPNFYDCLWSGVKPLVGGAAFHQACAELRACAESEAEALDPPAILPRLSALGYDDREIDEIRACNEVFSVGNMPYLLLASLARMLLEGHEWRGEPREQTAGTPPPTHPRPILIEAHHADPTIAALYGDIRQTLGLPFVNTDYRAFARWPSYFVPAWGDLKRVMQGADYADHVARVHDKAVALAGGLSNATRLTPDALRAAAEKDAPAGQVLDVVRTFQWLLPGLATNVAFWRAQLL